MKLSRQSVILLFFGHFLDLTLAFGCENDLNCNINPFKVGCCRSNVCFYSDISCEVRSCRNSLQCYYPGLGSIVSEHTNYCCIEGRCYYTNSMCGQQLTCFTHDDCKDLGGSTYCCMNRRCYFDSGACQALSLCVNENTCAYPGANEYCCRNGYCNYDKKCLNESHSYSKTIHMLFFTSIVWVVLSLLLLYFLNRKYKSLTKEISMQVFKQQHTQLQGAGYYNSTGIEKIEDHKSFTDQSITVKEDHIQSNIGAIKHPNPQLIQSNKINQGNDISSPSKDVNTEGIAEIL